MVRPDFEKWNQTAEDVRRLSVEAEHPRSRERFQALYIIGSHQDNASHWAQGIKRQKQTVLKWVHRHLWPDSGYSQVRPHCSDAPTLTQSVFGA